MVITRQSEAGSYGVACLLDLGSIGKVETRAGGYRMICLEEVDGGNETNSRALQS